MISKVPLHVKKVLNILTEHNFKAYIVGGSLRDLLLGNTPSDWDLASDALPEKIKNIFDSQGYTIYSYGEKYGSITIEKNNFSIEITTFRQDYQYDDYRRPNKVTFTNDLIEDLKRRDFTINAMALGINNQLVDPFNGRDDLNNRIIRTVGDAKNRFKEDSLRILRAIRFAALLDFNIEKNTATGIKCFNKNIKYLSIERINNELSKAFNAQNFKKLIYLIKIFKLLECLKIETKKHYFMNLSINKIPNHYGLRLASFGYLLFKGDYKKNFTQLNFPSQDVADAVKYIHYFNTNLNTLTKVEIKKMIDKLSKENVLTFLKTYEILVKPLESSIYNQFIEVKMSNTPLNLEALALNGDDLIKLGIAEGETIGRILNDVLEKVLAEEVKNNKKDLIKYVKKEKI